MKVMESRELLSLWVAVFLADLGAAVVWSGPEGFALLAKIDANSTVCQLWGQADTKV